MPYKLPVYVPVVDLKRGGFVDQRFFGLMVLFNENGLIEKLGEDNNYPFFLRSLMKPLQASILADYNMADFSFSEEEIAIMQASHSGEKIHTDLVKSILSKIELEETFLLCPEIPPLNSSVLEGKAPFKIHNNCSGKHSMFLSVCKKLKFPYEDYNSPNHPIQEIVLKKIEELTGFKNPPLGFDGCTLPVYAVPFGNIFEAFFKLYNDKKYNFLKEAYMKNPYVIGGLADDGVRIDTEIMLLNPSLISKTGAGGFLSVYHNERKEFLLIKMSGDNNFIRRLFVLKVLETLNWITKNPADYNFYDEMGRKVGEFFVNGF